MSKRRTASTRPSGSLASLDELACKSSPCSTSLFCCEAGRLDNGYGDRTTLVATERTLCSCRMQAVHEGCGLYWRPEGSGGRSLRSSPGDWCSWKRVWGRTVGFLARYPAFSKKKLHLQASLDIGFWRCSSRLINLIRLGQQYLGCDIWAALVLRGHSSLLLLFLSSSSYARDASSLSGPCVPLWF